MTALMPRLFGEFADWFETDFPLRPGHHLIRVEDERTEHAYTLRAELPGLDPEKDIQLSVDDRVLTVQAERRQPDRHRHHSEFQYGLLRRSVRLPSAADTEHVKAVYDKGVLVVTVPLTAPEPNGRPIAIAAAG